jgi:methyl-accepting chemotaxis protein
MTEEERFSTITITKKMPIHPPPMLRLEVRIFSTKKIKGGFFYCEYFISTWTISFKLTSIWKEISFIIPHLCVSNIINTQLLTADEITIDTKSFYEATSPAREKMFAAAGQMVQLLEMRIAEKYEQLNVVKWETIVVIITVSLAVLYLFAVFYRSVHQHVTFIEERTLQTAKGDLMVQLHIHTKDEFARIAHSFNSLIHLFRTIIRPVEQFQL